MKAFPRNIEVATMTERHVGIENELDITEMSVDNIYDALSRHGILSDIGYDGGGREFRTVPISIKSLKQVRGHKYLSEYFDIIKPKSRVIGSGGTHIHI